MRKFIFMIGVLALLIPTQGLADSKEKPVIVIIPFENATGKEAYESLSTGLPDLLTAFLSPYDERVTIIDRGLLESVFSEKSLSWEGFTSEKSWTQLGQLSQADYILRGSVLFSDNKFTINASLYELESTQLLKAFESYGSSKNLSHLVQKITVQLAEYLKTDIKLIEDLPIDDNPEKSFNFISGVGYYYNGQFELALTYFMKVLESHPDDELAQYWLAKTFQEAGMVDHAQLEFRVFLKKHPKSEKFSEVKGYLIIPKEEKEKGHEEVKVTD